MRKYFVKQLDDHEISPEETLADGMSGHSSVEMPVSKAIFGFFYVFMGVVFLLFLIQAFKLQVVQGVRNARFADQSNHNAYAIPALRGTIVDTHGAVLVNNVPVFDLVAVRSSLFAEKENPRYLELDALVDLPEGGVSAIVEKYKTLGVFVIKKNLEKSEAIRVQAANIPGIFVVPYSRRYYELGPVFSHVIGYTAWINEDELANDIDHVYSHHDRVGRLGVEAYYESDLHGDARSVLLEGATTSQTSEAKGGNGLELYLDADIQKHLYDSLNQIFAQNGVRRGAAVLQDVRTGEVLAMVSMPAFDPNIFEDGNSDATQSRQAVINDTAKPLFNRAVSGLYSPGSTIKPLYALAGLREHIVTPSTVIQANGSLEVQSEVDPSVTYTFRDWKVHGPTDLRKSIAWSVDIYYYLLGGGYRDFRGLGIDRIQKYLELFLADKKTGIDLPAEVEGFIPSRQWKKEKKNDSWYVGDTYNVSIGQGDLIVTPIWINSYVSAIANGGTMYKPHIVKKILDPSGQTLKEIKPEILTKLPFERKDLDVVREGMRQTVTDGTAQLLKDLPVQVAAKTGTAQVANKALNSLFTVWGPYDNPEISLTILVENIPQSQSLGVQVANKFFMWYFQQNKTL